MKDIKAEEMLKEKYAQMKYFEEKIGELQQQMQMLEQQSEELHISHATLKEFNGLKQGDEMLIPLSQGVFAKATLKEANTVLVNVGVDTVVKQTADQARGLIATQIEEVGGLQQKVIANIQKVAHRAQAVEKELKAIAEQLP
ncbi:prefoldin subunit alpha [Candidatus Woesearchaeota archaeon]|nr:prefoldin subunit alpha [Candidatus Woesearchaeota archaeon]